VAIVITRGGTLIYTIVDDLPIGCLHLAHAHSLVGKKPPSVNNLTMAGSVCSTSTSTYLSTLSSADRQRYDLKLQGSGFKFQDPYSIDKSEWNSDLSLWPDISFGSINKQFLFFFQNCKCYISF